MLRSQNRHGLKSSCAMQQPVTPLYLQAYQNQSDVVTFQTHSQKMDLKKEEENGLFSKVLTFLKSFLEDKLMQLEIQQHMSKYGKSSQGILSEKKNEKQLSFKKMAFGSKICFDAQVVRRQDVNRNGAQKQNRAVRGNNKKISIFIMQEQYSSSSSQDFFSDDIISDGSIRTIRSIEIPQLAMNLQTIALIYDTPQPFLINLSLCLFIRYCFATKRRVKLDESAWVLSVATVVSYKLYYDEEIEGLIDCFMGIMHVEKKDLIDLQRCFLQEIDYNTVIRNYDYHFILAKLISIPISKAI